MTECSRRGGPPVTVLARAWPPLPGDPSPDLEVTPHGGPGRALEQCGRRRPQAAWSLLIVVSGRLLGAPPFLAGRVPALEPDFRELTLPLEHGQRRLLGLFCRLRRPRVQEICIFSAETVTSSPRRLRRRSR